MIKYKITKSNLHIPDSYLIEKKKFPRILAQIKGIHPESDVWKRSFLSLSRELAVHNFCYAIHFKRKQTKDCDLDYPCDKPEWVYKLVGLIVWVFVK